MSRKILEQIAERAGGLCAIGWGSARGETRTRAAWSISEVTGGWPGMRMVRGTAEISSVGAMRRSAAAAASALSAPPSTQSSTCSHRYASSPRTSGKVTSIASPCVERSRRHACLARRG